MAKAGSQRATVEEKSNRLLTAGNGYDYDGDKKAEEISKTKKHQKIFWWLVRSVSNMYKWVWIKDIY